MALIIGDDPYGRPITPHRSEPGWGAGAVTPISPVQPSHFPGIRTPGYTPDYNGLLSQDPGLMSIRNTNQFNLAQAGAQRDAMLQKLQYGYSGAGNRFATLAQLTRQLKEANFLGTKANRARGAYNSGEQPWMIEHNQYAHDLGKYDASRQYEDSVAAALQQYLGVSQQAAQAENQGISEAADRMASNPIHQPTEGYAAYDDGLSSQYGHPVYRDMSGRMWITDESGNTTPFNP